MIFTETKLKGAFIVDVDKRQDPRGFFARTFCQKEFESRGLMREIAQTNVSYNYKSGTLRGMHFQRDPFQEVKIVSCLSGAVLDVIIDLRKDSTTYKHWVGVELIAGSGRMLYVPKDFAHGYLTLKDDSTVMYFVSQFYTPQSDGGVRYNDPAFHIEWPQEVPIAVITDKDKNWPDYKG